MKRARLTNNTLGVFLSQGELGANLAKLGNGSNLRPLLFIGHPEAPGTSREWPQMKGVRESMLGPWLWAEK